MKKLIPLLLIVSACSISYAESMKFITVLSSPVGTFNKLEAVDPAQPAKGNTVNFCTNIGTQGVVELKGTKPAALTTVSLSNHTTLGKTDEGKFSLNNITLKQGGDIKGGRLFGNTVTVNNAASGKANNVYGKQLSVAGAKTNNLTVTNSSYIKKGEQNSAVINNPPDMVWSNQYQSDDACKEGASYEKCKQQYLLKSGGVSGSEEDSGSKCTHCTAYEKGSSEYNNCVKNSVLTIDSQCCSEAYSFFSTQTEKEKTKCWQRFGCDRTYGGSNFGDTDEQTRIDAGSLAVYFPKHFPYFEGVPTWESGPSSFEENCLGLKGNSFFRKKNSSYVEYIPWFPKCTQPEDDSSGCEQFLKDGCGYTCQVSCYRADKEYFCRLYFIKPEPLWGWYNGMTWL